MTVSLMNTFFSWFNDLLVGGNQASLGVQLGVIFADTLILTYGVAFLTKRFTYINSHGWVLIDAVVASVLCFLAYRLIFFFHLRFWIAFIGLCLFAGVVEKVVRRIDRGALIDVTATGKALFHTDARLIRRSAMFATTMLLIHVNQLGKL